MNKMRVLFMALLFISLIIRLIFIHTGLEYFSVNGDEATSFLQANWIARGNYPLLFWAQPYQFPIEPYLTSLWAQYLPWDTFGVRLIPLIICLIAFCSYLFLFSKLGNFKTTWPGLTLILFPSTYLLIRQTQLLTPQHSICLLYTSPSPRDKRQSRMPSSA